MTDDRLTDAAATPPGTPGTLGPEERAAARRTALIRAVLVGAYLVVVFGVLLPRVVDYRDVVAAFLAVPAQWLAVVVLVGVVAWIAEGLSIKALLPELGVFRAVVTWLAMSAPPAGGRHGARAVAGAGWRCSGA